jgi:hypothetical protein
LEPAGKARRGASRVHANEADGFETALTGLSARISLIGADDLVTHRVRLGSADLLGRDCRTIRPSPVVGVTVMAVLVLSYGEVQLNQRWPL